PGSKDSGGELGWVGKGQFVKAFEDAANALPIGAISDPVKSDFGYHVIQVEERKPASENDVVKRWLASGFTIGDIKAHSRYDVIRDGITKKRQDQAITSPTAQVHVAMIQVAAPRPTAGDFQTFTAQLQKVADINKALDGGTDFAEVAKKYSEDSATKDKGGDIGWLARGMLTDLGAENELFNLDAGARSQQHNGLAATIWYKVIEKSASRDLEDDQKTKIKDSAYQYWLSQQKKAHDVLLAVPRRSSGDRRRRRERAVVHPRGRRARVRRSELRRRRATRSLRRPRLPRDRGTDRRAASRAERVPMGPRANARVAAAASARGGVRGPRGHRLG
ncbi:MAG: hypothetical protein E6I28_09090, partial [Chloroflexi bacterium]